MYRPQAPASGSASGPVYRPGNSTAAPTSGPAAAPTSGPAATPTSGPAITPRSGPATAPRSDAATPPTSRSATAPTSRPATAPTSGPVTSPTSWPGISPAPRSAVAPTTGSAHGSAHVPTPAGPQSAPPGAGRQGQTPTAGMLPPASAAHPARPGMPPQPGPNPGAAGTTQPHLTAPGTAQPHPAPPGTAQPHPAPPGTAQPQPAPPGVTQPYPNQPYLPQPQPQPQAAAQPHPAPPGVAHPGTYGPPGPYPPTVDPRALPPHPQINQGTDPTAPPSPNADPFQDLPWVSDTPTAEEFARRRMAKQAEPTATMGARALLRKGTMGLVKLAPSKHEVEFKQDVEMVRRNFGGLRQVTVVNPKGGAGKTIAVLLLAMTFGQKRGGYVLAWDNNETQGTLGMRAQQDFHARTVRDMMRDLHLFRHAHGGRVGDLSQYVRAQGEGMFDVLASDESATAGEMLTASAFAEIREIVSRFYKLIFVDTGNNVRAQNWQAAMDATDQLVITMSARNDSAETAARMLDHLEQSGRQRLVRQAVSIVSMPPTRKDIDLPAIQRHFAARTRAVLLAPYEKLIDSGEPLRYGQLSTNTKDAWLKIAAAVAEGL
ncbi:chromosome partitioning protein [Actinoplanes sp. NPDC051343]|uniref:chromosome partitioning protein n=1 Tax=Actinoplanes sp. NPDC051343 TaxID=3363906 RepID=UPI0037B10DC3